MFTTDCLQETGEDWYNIGVNQKRFTATRFHIPPPLYERQDGVSNLAVRYFKHVFEGCIQIFEGKDKRVARKRIA